MEGEKEELAQSLFEEKQLYPAEVLRTIEIQNFEPAKEISKLKNWRIELAQIEGVNLQAEKEFKEAQQKRDFFLQQQADLEQSIASLEQAIVAMDEISRAQFLEAFTAINQKFTEFFPLLFGGGEAYLSLLEPENILESGIEISARPPAKKIQSLNLLSGGEKAMTAIALILAIFHYKPSPFCVFDEIDAPLDIANVGRFGKIMQALAETSQIVLITHNPNTISIADYLYGITMEQPGVSRVVSVNLKSYQAKIPA